MASLSLSHSSTIPSLAPSSVEFHPLHLFCSSHRHLPLFFISYRLISSPQVGLHFTAPESSISSSYYSILGVDSDSSIAEISSFRSNDDDYSLASPKFRRSGILESMQSDNFVPDAATRAENLLKVMTVIVAKIEKHYSNNRRYGVIGLQEVH
ncbi:uncharacterized protein G2W53_010440 [Senna tora]|uniref:Uncharacterized protein n=1 Tax=Senna tora TaxID=362788 RepID=A0A834WZX8_9FABA|nr:uncharacterized protein G2W53_010440 [Senna tora]